MRAQESVPVEKLYMESLGVNEGLSAGLVYQIAQDHKGYIWLATSRGLSRYDGHRIKTFVHDAKDSLSLPENDVTNLFIDSRGWLWGSTRQEGLFVFDYASEDFILFNLDVINAYPTPPRICEDVNGNLWIPTQHDGWKIIQVPTGTGTPASFRGLSFYQNAKPPWEIYPWLPEFKLYEVAFVSKHSGVWIHKEHTLLSYSIENKDQLAPLQWSLPFSHDPNNDFFQSYRVFTDKTQSRPLLFTLTHLIEINDEAGKLDTLSILPNNLEDLPHRGLMDSKSQMWVSTNQMLLRFNLLSGDWVLVNREGPESLPQYINLTTDIIEDIHGNIWLATAGYGTFKHTQIQAAFHYWGENRAGPSMGNLLHLGNGRIDLGIIQEISFLEYQTGKSGILIPKSQIPFSIDHRMKPVIVDSFGIWLMGNIDEDWNLMKFDKSGRLLKQFSWPIVAETPSAGSDRLLLSEDSSLIHTFVENINTPGHKYKKVYLGIVDALHTSEPPRKLFEYELKDAINAYCIAITESIDGKIWLGHTEGGLLVFNPRKETWKHFGKNEQGGKPFPSDNVYSFLNDPVNPQQTMWIGTTEGLVRMDLKTDSIVTFTTHDGLPDNVIYGILADERNNLWLSTNFGLCRFNPTTGEVHNFTLQDGIQHLEFNRYSNLKLADGTMFFGGVGGLTWFDPEQLYLDFPPAEVVINGFFINNQSVEFGSYHDPENGGGVLTKSIEYTSKVELKHNQQNLKFEFASLDLTNSSKNQYRYLLEGLDEEWIELGNKPEVIFTNLPPNEYTLRVQGSNSQGEWNEEGTSIQLKVLPPWWATWWFRTLLFSAITFFVYFFVKAKVQAKLKVEALRNQISQDLHDEVGSTLSSISLFNMGIKKTINHDPPMAHQLVNQVDSKVTHIIESMNDIIWAIDTENDDLADLINRMRGYATDLGKTGEWKFKINCPPSLSLINLDIIQKRNIYMIYKEAINNAIKYSQGKIIDINFEPIENRIKLTISDDGIGFDPLDIHKKESTLGFGGNGLRNMKKRAKELGGELAVESLNGTGTKIIFTFCP
ncbi:MAG: two-component regulator propeller domain-containing protein [Bacteroidota bacterium]